MFKKSIAAMSLLAVALTGCFSARDYVVESDYSYSARFLDYKTFDFMQQVGQAADTNQQFRIIAESIARQMRTQGYTRSKENPDLLVTFKIFDGDFTYTGYNQPDMVYWAKQNDWQLRDRPDTVYVSAEEVGEEYRKRKYALAEGTLLVLFLDTKKSATVWQGYASGLFGNRHFDDERYLQSVVYAIFDQYRFLAYAREQEAKKRKK